MQYKVIFDFTTVVREKQLHKIKVTDDVLTPLTACVNLIQQQAPSKEPVNKFTKVGYGQQSTRFAQYSPVIVTRNTLKECSWSKVHTVLLAQGWIRHLQRFLPT